ncbi:MAG: hypothetical protein HUJ25_12850 [Crocinitomicaceae bacterium]|nr:hypothetical protein [Crocinitomicaceae bacterium]
MRRLVYTLTLALSSFSINHAQTVNHWQGTVNNNWSTAGNWSLNQIPGSGDPIAIDSSTYQLVLDDDVSIDDFTINSGATVDFGIYSVVITGDFTNNGLIEPGTSKVSFKGTQQQTISGTQNFYNLDIDNAAGVQISNGTTFIEHRLNVLSGQFSTNDALTLLSGPNNEGSIGPIVGSISGDVTVRKSIQVDSSDWRFLGSPVKNATLAQLNDDMWTSGYTGSTYPSYPFVSIYFYDETVSGLGSYGYYAPNSANDTIGAGQGFMAYIGTASLYGNTVDFKGEVNSGSVSLPVSYTSSGSDDDGWSYVANPFASAIDFDSPDITRTGVNNAVYIWNPNLEAYATYVDGISTNGGSNIISSCQSFWVKATSTNAELVIPQSAKSADNGTFLKQQNGPTYMSITLTKGNASDQTVLKANPNATMGFDGSMDAYKFNESNGYNPVAYTKIDGGSEIYSINQIPVQEAEVLLYAKAGVSGQHTLTFEDVSSFTDSQCLILEDMFTGNTYPLYDNMQLTVDLSDTTTVARFRIKVGAPLYVEGYNATCYNTNDGHINVGKNTNTLYDVTLTDQWGGVIQQETNVNQITSFDNLGQGIYMVETDDQLCGLTIDTIVIDQPSPIIADFDLSADTLYISNEFVEVDLINTSQNADYYTWEVETNPTSTQTDLTVQFYSAGVYTATLYAYQSPDCYVMEDKNIVVMSTLNAGEIEHEMIQMYLNNQVLNIEGHDSNASVKLYNVNGQLLHTQNIQANYDQVQLSDIPQQLLIVVIQSDNGLNQTNKVLYR